jgi:hypothetical protein|tara:strand:- start:1355 stop:1636 length:282 start_codon:yes stop_codon:yes gene_type:complete
MIRDVNYKAERFETPQDEDLVEAELAYGSSLPWLPRLLEEIQALRDDTSYADIQADLREAADDDEALSLRVAYLQGILDRIGARYEEKTPAQE